MKKLLAEGVDRLYFMGTGGVQLLTHPAIVLCRAALEVSGQRRISGQVVIDPPAGLDKNSLVVIPSLSGTTKESVKLLAFLKARGVRTLSLTGHKGHAARPRIPITTSPTSPRSTPPRRCSTCRPC